MPRRLCFHRVCLFVKPKLHLYDLLWICCTTSCGLEPIFTYFGGKVAHWSQKKLLDFWW